MKLFCKNCNWMGEDSETIQGVDPETGSKVITACPRCLQITRLVSITKKEDEDAKPDQTDS